MKLNNCAICGSSHVESITDTLETVINGKTLVIENIQAEKCMSCGEVYYSSVADEYIEMQIEFFKKESNKLVFDFKYITKENGKYYINNQ